MTKKVYFSQIHNIQVGRRSDFILLFLIRSYSCVIVHCCQTFSVEFQWLMFVGVIFSVMYKFVGHIHSVIFNRSSLIGQMSIPQPNGEERYKTEKQIKT